MGRSSNWWRIYCVISLWFAILACVAFSAADDYADPLEPFRTKCSEILTSNNDKVYVIWDAHSDLIYPCSDSSSRRNKLSKIFDDSPRGKAARNELLKFRNDGRVTDFNEPIPLSVLKVKKGKRLSSLTSKAYGDSIDFSKITGAPIDPNTQEIVSEGYVFFRRPAINIEKKCVIGIIPDGFSFRPQPNNKVKKNCILRTIPLHFEGVSVDDVAYPALSIEGRDVEEGGVLEFTVTKQGNQDLPATFSYQVVPGTASKDDYELTEELNTFILQPDQRSHVIKVQTKEDSQFEADEKISVQIIDPRNPDNTNIIADAAIKNDDFKATISVLDDNVIEGGKLEFKVERAPESNNEPFSIGYEVVALTADTSDFRQSHGRLDFAANDLEKIITVETYRDELEEGQEEFRLRLLPEEDIQIKLAEASGYINDDVVVPQSGPFKISDATATEGQELIFNVTRAQPSGIPVKILYQVSGDISASGELEFGVGVQKVKFSIQTNNNNQWEADKSAQVTISSTDPNINFDNSTAKVVIKEASLKPSCDTDGSFTPVEQVDARINEVSTDAEHKNLFSLKGTAASCHYLAFSMNEYFVIDAQAYQLVTTRADINGEWSWNIISGGDNAETRLNLRQAALETKSKIEGDRGSSAPPIAYTNHFSDDPNIFEVYSNQESIDRDTISELLNFSRANHLSKTDNISLVTEEEDSACSIKSVEFKLPKISTEQRLRNSSPANIKLNPSEREGDKCGLLFSFQNLNDAFEYVFVVTKTDNIIFQEDLAKKIKTQFVPIPDVPNPYRFFIAKKIAGASITCGSNNCEQAGVPMKSLEPNPSIVTGSPPGTGNGSTPPFREFYKADPLTQAKLNSALATLTPDLQAYNSNVPISFVFKEEITVKRGEAISDKTRYLFDPSGLGADSFHEFFERVGKLKAETKAGRDSLCLRVTTPDASFPFIAGKENKLQCEDVDNLKNRAVSAIALSGNYERNGFEIDVPFSITAELFLRDISPAIIVFDGPFEHRFAIRDEDSEKCFGGLIECDDSRWWITTLIAVMGLILTAIGIWLVWKPRESSPGGQEQGPQDTVSPPVISTAGVAATAASGNGEYITSTWLARSHLNFNQANTRKLENVLKDAYNNNQLLRQLTNSAGIEDGLIHWDVADNILAQPILKRAAAEGKLVNLIVAMLRDPSIVGSHATIREMLNDEALEVIQNRLEEE